VLVNPERAEAAEWRGAPSLRGWYFFLKKTIRRIEKRPFNRGEGGGGREARILLPKSLRGKAEKAR